MSSSTHAWIHAAGPAVAPTAQRHPLHPSANCAKLWAGSDFALRRQLTRLVELEYLFPIAAGAVNSSSMNSVDQRQGTAGEPFTLGLVDPETLSDPES